MQPAEWRIGRLSRDGLSTVPLFAKYLHIWRPHKACICQTFRSGTLERSAGPVGAGFLGIRAAGWEGMLFTFCGDLMGGRSAAARRRGQSAASQWTVGLRCAARAARCAHQSARRGRQAVIHTSRASRRRFFRVICLG